MAEIEEPSRPTAVTVIGWMWLVAAVLFLFRSLVNLVVWRILQPELPDLLALDGASAAQLRFLRPVFEHLTAFQTTEAILSATVVVLAIQFLRLREWARVGLQAACWLLMAGVVAFGAFWCWLWERIAAARQPPGRPLGAIGLIVVLAVCVAAAAGLALMISVLRSSRVRRAFRRLPESIRNNAG